MEYPHAHKTWNQSLRKTSILLFFLPFLLELPAYSQYTNTAQDTSLHKIAQDTSVIRTAVPA